MLNERPQISEVLDAGWIGLYAYCVSPEFDTLSVLSEIVNGGVKIEGNGKALAVEKNIVGDFWIPSGVRECCIQRLFTQRSFLKMAFDNSLSIVTDGILN